MATKQAKLRVWIHGSTGRMGCAIAEVISESKFFTHVGGSAEKLDGKPITAKLLADAVAKSSCDVVVDFSSPTGNKLLLEATKSAKDNCAVLIGTTGLPKDQVEGWRKSSKAKNFPVLFAANTSLGILLAAHVSQMLTKVLKKHDFDIEISESHHRDKKDSPSGTALFLADACVRAADGKLKTVYGRPASRGKNEIGISSIRGGHVFGEHDVKFLGDNEELHVTHRALNRTLFAQGALVLSQWISQKKPGVYELFDVDLSDLT